MKRGDIVTVAAGSGFGSKPRPALILQSDDYPTSANVVLALLTSSLTPNETVRPRIEPSAANGLLHVSDLMVDVLITVRREKTGAAIGRLSDDDMVRVERALLLFLGMAG